MKILQLIIKQSFFDEIANGTKDFEERELRPASEKRYIQYNEDGDFEPIKYDAIKFFVGYNKDRDEMTVKITDIDFIDIVDEAGEIITVEDEKGVEYDLMVIRYGLGEIIDIKRNKKK